MLLVVTVATQVAFASYSDDYKKHIAPDRLLLTFDKHFTQTEKEHLLISSGYVSAFTHLPAPAVTIAIVSDRGAATEYFNQLPGVKAVSFFITDGKHFAGVLNRIFVKLTDKNFEPLFREKIHQLGLPAPVRDKYISNLFTVENTLNRFLNSMDLASLFSTEPWCSYSTPDFLVNPLVTSNDPLYNRQWAIANNGTTIQGSGTPDADMDVDSAWNIITGSSDIKISIIDSGVDTLQPDLVQNILPGYDAVSDSTDGYPTPAYDNDGHGTCCAGIVAAVKDNNIGISGVAPSCKIIPVRAFYYILLAGASDPLPFSTASAFADAIGWSWSVAGADILSNSWGLPPSLIGLLQGGTQPVNDAIATAHSQGRGGKGTAMFFSSGNENGSTGPIWPASHPLTIAVNATTMCDERKNPNDCSGENWWGGDYGPGLDFSAPGVKVSTTDMRGGFGFNNGDYTYTFNGTSAACPNAAGVGALVLSLRPELQAEDIRNILSQSCDKTGGYAYDSVFYNGTWCPELGYGRLNAHKALLSAFNYSSVADNPGENDSPTTISPNPANGYTELFTTQKSDIAIINLAGEIVSSTTTEGEKTRLNTNQLPAGVYIISLKNQQTLKTLKLVVSR